MEIFVWRGLGSSLLLLVSGCAAAEVAQPAPRSARHEYSVPRTVITPQDTASIPELYQHARSLAESGKHAEAAAEFARVYELDVDGELADAALFQCASERDRAGSLESSAFTYEQLARRFPKSEFSSVALVRATRLLARLDQWQHAGELANLALSSQRELGPLEAISAYSASALSRLENEDERGAESFIEKGRALVDEYRLDAAGSLPIELAPLYFALGELRRRRGERISFDPLPKDFADALERRCQLILDAHSAYSDAMRAYDVHFSAIAGYRVGELYERLHEDVMRVAPPPSADTVEKRQLFEAGMRLRYAVLLDKARQFMEHTLGWVERNGEHSEWVEKTHEAIAKIREASRREEAALAALPYPRATLEAALADLQRRTQEKEKRDGRSSPVLPGR